VERCTQDNIIVIAGATLFSLLACAAPGQYHSRSVSGYVMDRGREPLRGAVVKIKNMITLDVRSYMTQKSGEYQFQGLHPDTDYELQARYRGCSSDVKTLSRFDSREQARIDLEIVLTHSAAQWRADFVTNTPVRVSRYFFASLSSQFDAILQSDETPAVEPLERAGE